MNGHENTKSSDPPNIVKAESLGEKTASTNHSILYSCLLYPPNVVKAESLGEKTGLALITQRVSENVEF